MELKFRKIKYTQLSTEHGRKLRLNEKPGVYAWFRDFDLRCYVNDKVKFITKLESLLDVNLSDTFHSKVGFIYDVVLTERTGQLSDNKREWLNKLCEHQDGRLVLSEILMTICDIQSPLYIGKALNIRNRIAEHINGQSELVERLQSANIEINDCFIKVVYLDHEKLEHVSGFIEKDGLNALALLVEDLITRLGPAAFVRRPG